MKGSPLTHPSYKQLRHIFRRPKKRSSAYHVSNWTRYTRRPTLFLFRWLLPSSVTGQCRSSLGGCFQGPCCTSGCTLRNGDKCRDDNGCRDASFCDGRGPQCPPSINKPNKTICNEEFVCYMGVSLDVSVCSLVTCRSFIFWWISVSFRNIFIYMREIENIPITILVTSFSEWSKSLCGSQLSSSVYEDMKLQKQF